MSTFQDHMVAMGNLQLFSLSPTMFSANATPHGIRGKIVDQLQIFSTVFDVQESSHAFSLAGLNFLFCFLKTVLKCAAKNISKGLSPVSSSNKQSG